LAKLAAAMAFVVTVVDRRPAYATKERFPDAEVVVGNGVSFEMPERAAAVVMSHHYLSDRDYLKALLPRPIRYLGLIGPRRRAEKMLQEIREEGVMVGDELLAKLHNPVGLDIGAEGPEEIALAILAEINAVFAGHGGGMLREKKGPIHAARTELR
jgi:xanthine/CO dehydrogenase XdhC/CoxF family maturation factor